MNASQRATDKPSATPEKRSLFERILKWVAAITAVLSLFFAIQKVTQLITDNNSRALQLTELKQLAQMQQKGGDYAQSWESYSAALKLAESGGTFAKLFGKLDAQTATLRIAREDLAIEWLGNISISGGQKFSDIVDKLTPVLEQGVLTAQAQRKADLLAHIGWGYFLRGRDGGSQLDPVRQYEQAVTLDAQNPYAHAYWAHWLIWNGSELAVARSHFTQALATPRARERVRTMQLAAFRNRGSGGDASFIATVMDMLKNDETLTSALQHEALNTMSRACPPRNDVALLAELKAMIPAADLAVTYKALIAPSASTMTSAEKTQREVCAARFQ